LPNWKEYIGVFTRNIRDLTTILAHHNQKSDPDHAKFWRNGKTRLDHRTGRPDWRAFASAFSRSLALIFAPGWIKTELAVQAARIQIQPLIRRTPTRDK
jgi:hypothetical protein